MERVDLLIVNARIMTLALGAVPRRGTMMRELEVIERGDVAVRDGRIVAVGSDLAFDAAQRIDADGRLLTPGFVDCHTHACWAGDRLDEWESRLEGTDYLSILKAGGGIMSTVRATRSASLEELTRLTLAHLDRLLTFGTTTAEVKTGYGLATDHELKMLAAIEAAGGEWANKASRHEASRHQEKSHPHCLDASMPRCLDASSSDDESNRLRIMPTFLGAHAIDPDQPDFVEKTINETLPAVVAAHPGIVCDAYCEDGAWSLDEVRRLFEEATSLGCPLRIHTDQFHSLGATRLAVEMGALSVDHLEASTAEDLELVARSDTVAVLLPCTGFHTDGRYAPGRVLIDADGIVALATNYNPGSAPCPSMPFAMALACRMLHLTPAEAWTAATVNAACVLGLEHEVGRIEEGMRADLVLWDEFDERAIPFEFATTPPRLVIAAGQIVRT